MIGLHGRVTEESIIKSVALWHPRLAVLGIEKIGGTAETAIYNGTSLWADYWIQTICELRQDLTSSGKLSNALVDTLLGYCADPAWWAQTIAFTAVHGYAPNHY